MLRRRKAKKYHSSPWSYSVALKLQLACRRGLSQCWNGPASFQPWKAQKVPVSHIACERRQRGLEHDEAAIHWRVQAGASEQFGASKQPVTVSYRDDVHVEEDDAVELDETPHEKQFDNMM
jgi:hypothetical protein